MEQKNRDILGSAFVEVLSESGFSGARVLEDLPDSVAGADILCSVGIAGGISGFLLLSFLNPDLSSVAKRMTAHSGLGTLSDDGGFLKETAAELANQLAGRAVNAMAKHGIDCAITPPTLVTGSAIHAFLPHLGDKEAWKVDTGEAEFRISVITRKR